MQQNQDKYIQQDPEELEFERKFSEATDGLQTELDDDFELHRIHSQQLGRLVADLGDWQRAAKIRDCGTFLRFAIPGNFEEKPFLYRASFCKDRLCSLCGWRRSLKVYSQISQVMDVIQNDYRFIFVTLTLRNVDNGHLVSAINYLQKAWDLFMHYKEPRAAFRGYFKALEITKNPGLIGMEYHPHMHIIFAVDKKNYFRGDEYIPYEKLRALWQKALGVQYAPMVNIQAVKDKGTRDGRTVSYVNAIAEVAKYTLKSADLFKGSHTDQLQTVRTLTIALRGRRLCSFGGIFKKTWQDLKLPDPEEAELTDKDKIRSDVWYHIVNAVWDPKNKHYSLHYSGVEDELKRRRPKK